MANTWQNEEPIVIKHVLSLAVLFVLCIVWLLSFSTEDDIMKYYQKDYKHVKFYDSTIAEAGCGLCSAATVLSNNGCMTDPEEMLEIYTELYPNQKKAGVYSDFFIKLGFEKKSYSNIQYYLDNDYWVIINTGNEHWIVIYGDWEIIDPNKNIKSSRTLRNYKLSDTIYIFKERR